MNYPQQHKSRFSALLANAARLALAAGLIWWLIGSGSIKLDYLYVPHGRIHMLITGAAALLAAMILSGVRYRELINGSGVSMSLADSLKASAIMYFFTQCVLGPASGDVARYFYTIKSTGNRTGAGAAIIVDRFIGIMGLFMLAGIGMILNWSLVESSAPLRLIAIPLLTLLSGLWLGFFLGLLSLIKSRKTALITGAIFPVLASIMCTGGFSNFLGNEVGPVLLIVSISALAAPLVAPELLEGGYIREKILRGSVLGTKAGEFISALLVFRKCPKVVAATIAITALQHMLFIVALYLFAMAQNLPAVPDFSQIFFSAPLAFLAGIIPAPAAGLGVNEAAFETLLLLASANTVKAGASIYLMHRIWTTLFSLSAIPFLINPGTKKVASQ
ncbi:lysylphosphatidylglycerol synthase domain-containing protein [Maridesulfovibrio sp. FT414]|uniref:lysylphosphatidylglycerol synthase domain-containing protein n=1 Tax=Maridesulfovibrio sp. FT414 TaxID=2979469 RepID=UPI003D80779B